MPCERCNGLMVLDRLVDLESSELWLYAWRCANCGNVVDDQIRRHRVQPPTPHRGRPADHGAFPIATG
jgi:uncharacterized Zn finger protein